MRQTFTKRHVLYGVIGIIILNSFSSCLNKTESPDIIAKIGNRSITEQEYIDSYELAPRQLTEKNKSDARYAVLNKMIDRILLAKKAEDLGITQSDTVLTKILDFYKRKAINEKLYLKHVRNLAVVKEEEAREMFRRYKMTLFVKHFESESLDTITNVVSGMRDFKHIPIFQGSKSVQHNNTYVDVINWNELDEMLEELLYHLPIQQISEPLFDGRKYHIFKVVDWEKEVIQREEDFQANRESISGIIKKRKERKISSKFVKNTMDPQNVIIRADALNMLTDRLWDTRPNNTANRVQYIPDKEINFINKNQHSLSNIEIASFKDGSVSVSDLLLFYKVNPQVVNYSDKMSLRKSLTNAAALYVREWVFSEKGFKEGLDKHLAVKESYQNRREHLFAEKMIKYLYNKENMDLQTDEIFSEYLEEYISVIRKNTDISIFDEQLMTLKTTDEGFARKMDFISVQL